VPFIASAGELKTKPTQHSVKEMREIGIQPDILLCRCDRPLSTALKEKIALFSNVAADRVIAAIDVSCIYELPSCSTAKASTRRSTSSSTSGRASRTSRRAADRRALQEAVEGFVKIGVVGKYVHLRDSYKSLHEALVHGGLANDVKVELEYIDSEAIEQKARSRSSGPGRDPGAGRLRRARQRGEDCGHQVRARGQGPVLRDLSRDADGRRRVRAPRLRAPGANSVEFDRETPFAVIDMMADQKGVMEKGGRCGSARILRAREGVARRGRVRRHHISERHRHRYEVSNKYRDEMAKAGLVLSGLSPDARLVEMIELREHPYFVGCQFHPELKSRPHAPHPLFSRFVRAALECQTQRKTEKKTSGQRRRGRRRDRRSTESDRGAARRHALGSTAASPQRPGATLLFLRQQKRARSPTSAMSSRFFTCSGTARTSQTRPSFSSVLMT